MRTAKGIISFAGAVGDTINFNACNFRILGSSIPTLLEKGKAYGHVSITLPAKKQEALVFFITSRDNKEAFLKFRRKENGQAWAYLDEEMIPPCEMVVSGETITIKTNDERIISTDEKPGAYKVTHDAMCQFLNRDITEEELLAEAVKLAEKEDKIVQLRKRIAIFKNRAETSEKEAKVLKQELLTKIGFLRHVYDIANKPWYSLETLTAGRLRLIRKILSAHG